MRRALQAESVDEVSSSAGGGRESQSVGSLANYTLLDRIGAGGMGQVFKAEHRRMHRLVAIKMLPPAMMKDAESIARFQREVTAAAKLRHPNIVAADDADEANGTHFLVMEYVEGSDLSALVKKNGPFSYAKAANYIMQAAQGLEFAHSEGVIHRDIVLWPTCCWINGERSRSSIWDWLASRPLAEPKPGPNSPAAAW